MTRNILSLLKDIKDMSFNKLRITEELVSINGKEHKRANFVNIIVCKEIEIICNDEVFGMPAYLEKGVYIISINREQINDRIKRLNQQNESRFFITNNFFDRCLDQRKFTISKSDLPLIDVFSTKLSETSILFNTDFLNQENYTFIEGKPGVGKSHLVSSLESKYPKSILYRFWLSNQDSMYKSRLEYSSMLNDFSKKVFGDQQRRSKAEILEEIAERKLIVLIDGLDHVENYNPQELDIIVGFIEELMSSSKVIVLSRPIIRNVSWNKYILENWTYDDTKKVLSELYHISDCKTVQKIYDITKGYPIIVKYIAEHYKNNHELPDINSLQDLDDYYSQLLYEQKSKSALSIFLYCRSYLMISEINHVLGSLHSSSIHEFISENPYLFEIRLNRVSLFHDSLTTFLRKNNENYTQMKKEVEKYSYNSIMAGEKRFLSRFSFLDLSKTQRKQIMVKYLSIEFFKRLVIDTIDFEAIHFFYQQVRENLILFKPDELTPLQYYDLSLIINLIERNHISGSNGFLYTYVKCLLFNGHNEENITSYGELFSMLYYIQKCDSSLLYRSQSIFNIDLEYFHRRLNEEIEEEEKYFKLDEESMTVEHLKSTIEENKSLGSYDLSHIVHSYIRLALNEEKSIDISSIYLYWTKYYNRKDYSLLGVSEALTLFEDKNYLSHHESITLINEIQQISEKGYRGLMLDYIENQNPSIIEFLFEQFDTNELVIPWLLLPSEYISEIPIHKLFDELYEKIRYNRSKTISAHEVINVFNSKYGSVLNEFLHKENLTLLFKRENEIPKSIKESNIKWEYEKSEDYEIKPKNNSRKRFEARFLNLADTDFLRKNNISIIDIAKCSDVNNTALMNLELYEIFPVSTVNSNLNSIFYHAIIESNNGVYHNLLYYYYSHLLKMLEKYGSNVEWNIFYESLSTFMELSMFSLPNHTENN
jgi:hypothetical protein